MIGILQLFYVSDRERGSQICHILCTYQSASKIENHSNTDTHTLTDTHTNTPIHTQPQTEAHPGPHTIVIQVQQAIGIRPPLGVGAQHPLHPPYAPLYECFHDPRAPRHPKLGFRPPRGGMLTTPAFLRVH